GRLPAGGEYSLHPDFPNDLVLTDSLMNTDSLLVVSPRLKAYLQETGDADLEFYPVTILDHKGKLLSADYQIVNATGDVDCLDKEASGARASRVSPDEVSRVRKLALKIDQIPSGKVLFRIKGFPEVTMIRRDVAEGLDATGFTGFRWLEPDKFPEI